MLGVAADEARSGRLVQGFLLAALLASLAGCATTEHREPARVAPVLQDFEATAYSIEGKTATGGRAHEGICAADPHVLPLGSHIRVHEAGPYSGDYVVADTGRTVKGRKIDIFLADDAEAKRFGRKKVRVEILSSSR
jgi:3D (Asp-Asp-Asp) domain-containing protein